MSNTKLTIATVSGSIYDFGPPNNEMVRSVSKRGGKLPFTKCVIWGSGIFSILEGAEFDYAKVGERLIIRPIDAKEDDIWYTSRIRSIST